MDAEELKREVSPALLQRLTLDTMADMTAEQIGWFMKLKRDRPVSADYSPDELASMGRADLARIVPRPYLERYGLDALSRMSPNELEHLIPTNTWLNLKFKELTGPDMDVKGRLAIVGPDSEVSGVSAERPTPGEWGPSKGREPRRGDAGRWAVIYAPHPDDETFGLAGYTNQLFTYGWRIAQVLCTRGEASSYFLLGQSRGWWSDREEFGRLRTREWASATARISPACTIRFQYDCRDRELTIAEAKSIIEYVDAFVGGASIHCATRGGVWEPHVDHQALAEGLEQASVPAWTKRWYSVYSDWPFPRPGLRGYRLTRENRAAKTAALQEYRREDRTGGSFGIGYHTSPLIWSREMRDRREFIWSPGGEGGMPTSLGKRDAGLLGQKGRLTSESLPGPAGND